MVAWDGAEEGSLAQLLKLESGRDIDVLVFGLI